MTPPRPRRMAWMRWKSPGLQNCRRAWSSRRAWPPHPRTGKRNVMVTGHVVAIHIDDAFIVNGRFDTVRARPVARLGYMDYAVVDDAFAINRPSWPLKNDEVEIKAVKTA